MRRNLTRRGKVENFSGNRSHQRGNLSCPRTKKKGEGLKNKQTNHNEGTKVFTKPFRRRQKEKRR